MRKVAFAIAGVGLLVSNLYASSRYEIAPQESSKYEVIRIVDPLDKPIKVNVKDIDFSLLFSLISDQVGVPIVFKDIAQGDLKRVTYFSREKPLRQVLDELTSVQDLFWEYKDGKIEIFKHKAETFKINLPLLKKNINISRNELVATYQRDFWNNLEASLRQLLKDSNSKLSVNEMGYVFVWARPSELNLIRQAVERINRDYTRTIPLKVEVFIAREEDLKQSGIGFNFKGENVSGGLQNSLGMPLFNLSVLTSRLELELRLLATSGKLKSLDESLLVALNGQPVFYAPQTTKRIVSGYDVNYVGVGGGTGVPGTGQTIVPSVQVRTEDIKEGAVLVIVPYYIAEDRIVVEVFREDNRLERLERQQVSLPNTQATNMITLPQVAQRRSLSQTVLARGQKLLLVSSALTEEQVQESGIPFLKDIPVLGLLFGTKGKSKELYRIIITIGFDEGGKDVE